MSTTRARDESTQPMDSDKAVPTAHGLGVDKPRPPVRSATAAEQRITTFVHSDLGRVIAAVSMWCGSQGDAEAAVADATGRAWERLDRGRPIDNLAAWVATVAMNYVRGGHRRRARARRKGHLVASAGSTPATADMAADRIDLQRALARLGRRQREVVALHYGMGMTIAEISRQLSIAEGTVKATLHKSRQLLAADLGTVDTDGGTS